MEMKAKVEALESILKKAREDYYNLVPSLSDQEYDGLKEQLRGLCPDSLEVTAVGAAPPSISVWEKVRHDIPMGSLDKVNTLDEFKKWVSESNSTEFHMTHKIDGSSMELVYEKGKLVRCVTRGDGTVGEDVTKNIQQVPSIPKEVPVQIDMTVRGEIVMLRGVFTEKYAETYANPRNTAAAKVREKKKGGADCANLEYLAYWVKCEDRPKTMSEMFLWLKQVGFNVPPSTVGCLSDMEEDFKSVSDGRGNIPYDIDGQVVSVNNISELESLGESAMRPKGQIAWKFESEKAVTKVLNIVWQVGSTGRICPVAKVEPTQIGGVTIESVSLHNLKMFSELKLFQGCRVLVERRNDVIPYISKNLDMEAA